MKIFTGTLRFINQFKQLSIEIDEKTYETLSKLENHGEKSLAWRKNNDNDPDAEDTWHTKVSLVKYLKVDAELIKIEEMENKKVTMKVQIKHYESDEWGQGTTMQCRKIWMNRADK
jgi:hypothetical protein